MRIFIEAGDMFEPHATIDGLLEKPTSGGYARTILIDDTFVIKSCDRYRQFVEVVTVEGKIAWVDKLSIHMHATKI